MSIAAGDLVAVTGGTGDLGRRVAADLHAAGYRVRLLSRHRPAELDEGFEWRAFDLLDREPVAPDVLESCAAAVHLAAYIPSDQSDWSQAADSLLANGAGTARLLTAMEQAGVGRLVQSTAANAYRPGAEAPDESVPLYPSGRASFYLASKLVQDLFAAHWQDQRGLSAATLRVSALYGAGHARGLFTAFARRLLAGEQVRLGNGGTYGADFVTIADVSRAILLFLRSSAEGPFNIASGVRSSLLEVANHLVRLTGASRGQLAVEPVAEPDAGFPAIGIAAARAHGFAPTTLADGLRELVDWVKAEKDRHAIP